MGCTGGICNCSSFTQVAGTACKEIYDNKIDLSEGIQECLETVQDIKACNQVGITVF